VTARSSLAIIRNPVLALPAAQAILAQPLDLRLALAALLMDLGADAAAKAQHSWRRHKAPMALYWKCVSVYARHIARALTRQAVVPPGIDLR
jgi:hypothetical protein